MMNYLKLSANWIAVDLGASSGRVILGHWNSKTIKLKELHRFPNIPIKKNGHLYWNIEQLWDEIKKGLRQYTACTKEPLTSIGVDGWGVDFALLNKSDELIDLPFHYRDPSIQGVMEQVLAIVGKSYIYEETGLQFLPINTLYQIYRIAQIGDPQLDLATTMLMIPDLFHYRLSGKKATEYTNATTTQFYSVRRKEWNKELLGKLRLPFHFLLPPVLPGTTLGELLPELADELGLQQKVPVTVVLPGTHDTASAVAGIPFLDHYQAFISCGTWSPVGVVTTAPILSKTAMNLNFTNEGGVAETNLLMKNVMGLWLVQECLRNFAAAGHIYSWEDLVSQASQIPAFSSWIDPDDPTFFNSINILESIQEYCLKTSQIIPKTPGSFIRCCLESQALKYRLIIDQLEYLIGHSLKKVRLVGGGSQNKLLCQFVADACGREVIAGPVEAAVLGNIVVQGLASGQLTDSVRVQEILKKSVSLKHYLPYESTKWIHAFKRFKQLIEK